MDMATSMQNIKLREILGWDLMMCVCTEVRRLARRIEDDKEVILSLVLITHIR